MNHKKYQVCVIGAGLAGSECVYQLAKECVSIAWVEMRPKKMTEAHHTQKPAELVCSNSFRSNDITNAVGLIKEEMMKLDSLVMRAAYYAKVPAGSALAMDRDAFSDFIDQKLSHFKNLERIADEVLQIETKQGAYEVVCESGNVILAEKIVIATGPLTADSLSEWIANQTGQEYLYFYDAIAPIIAKESINMDVAFRASRYDKEESGDGDYINCPFNKEQYEAFISEIKNAEQIEVKDFDKAQFFDGCMPVEEMVSRGDDTLRFGPMKPVGLTNPHKPDEKAYAVIQLRQDNLHGSMYNIVGFQTRMKYGEQKRVFSMIPGLEKAEFIRLGSMHRNTYLCSPLILQEGLSLKTNPGIHFAGQIAGCEGYVESAAMGLYVGLKLSSQIMHKKKIKELPNTTAIGSLVHHILCADPENYQPMNINFGIFPDLNLRAKKFDRKVHHVKRAVQDFRKWYYDNF